MPLFASNRFISIDVDCSLFLSMWVTAFTSVVRFKGLAKSPQVTPGTLSKLVRHGRLINWRLRWQAQTESGLGMFSNYTDHKIKSLRAVVMMLYGTQ